MIYTNQYNLELAVAVWLLYDDYDYNAATKTVSATTLLAPTRSIILNLQHDTDGIAEVDISNLVASRMGSAIHADLEKYWKSGALPKALETLRMSALKDRLIVNPTKEDFETKPDLIPVYVENRSARQIDGWTVTGKYDIVLNGQVQDYKSTSVWAWIFNSNDEQYRKQGSIYRWLNPEIITEDTMKIHYFFTDWSATKAKQDKKYPQLRMLSKEYALLGKEETEHMVRTKLAEIDRLIDADQGQLPRCTPEELWQTDTVWKYFKNPNATRATRRCNSKAEADQLLEANAFVGKVIEVPGEIKRCKYCTALSICEQGQEYLADGRLNIE